MIDNRKIKFGMCLLIGVLLIVSISAYSRSTTQYIPPTSSSNYLNSKGISLTNTFNKDSCEAGQDFVVQVSPLGCTPTVVRSDLLEEQNVPVFCQLVATKINPLIEVEAIESISFKGDYPKEVSGVGFHPANAGIKTSQSTLLNSPVLNNIGYAVVVLKKQPNESAMPDFVRGNMTANIKYDVKNAFGIGKATYYLPQISDEDWALNYKQYGFWKGKGFLKAENIEKNSATISIYQNQNDKITSTSLTKGKTSGKVNVPGFYCLASLQLRLDGLVVPDTRAKFEISGETVEVIKGEKFLDNKCYVKSLDKKGLSQEVEVYCSTDDGSKTFDFKIAPKVRLGVGETEQDVSLGQKVFEDADKKTYVYVGYIGAKDISAGKVIDTKEEKNLTIYFYNSSVDLGEKLSDSKLSSIARSVESVLNKVINLDTIPDVKEGELDGIYYGEEKDVFGKKINVVGFAGAQDETFAIGVEDNYKKAIETYDEIIKSYSSLKFDEDENLKDVSYGEFALQGKIEIANNARQKANAAIFCEKFRERYPESKYLNGVEKICSESALANSESANLDVVVNGVVNNIRFEGIFEPSEDEYSAEVSVGDKDYVLTKNEVVELKDEKFTVQLISLDEDYAEVKVSYLDDKDKSDSKRIKLKEDVFESFGGIKIVLRKINLKKLAKVSVIPSIDNVGTEAEFTFNIGIEKRAIQLSPERTKEKIKSLNETIEKWEEISNKLGNVITGMKTACLATSMFLTTKNFFTGFDGRAGARQEVTEHYRNVVCKDAENMQACLYEKNEDINRDIETQAEIDTNRLERRDKLVDGYVEEGDKMVLSEKLEKEYFNEIKDDRASKELLKDENYKNELINLLRLQELKSKGLISEEEFKKESDIIWDGIDEDYKLSTTHEGVASYYGVDSSDVTVVSSEKTTTKGISNPKIYTEFESNFDLTDAIKKEIRKGSYARITVGADDSSKRYFVVFGKDGVITKSYNIDGKKLTPAGSTNPLKLEFDIQDGNSYKNEYKNYQALYHGSTEYKNLPKVVPVDIDEGFYAFTSTGSGKMVAYGDSSMPSYFYLCNVMGNNKEEAMGGDDDCIGVRVGENPPAEGRLGALSVEETNKWAKKAINVLRDVSSKYEDGITSVNIDGRKVPVGNPYAGAGTECVDFMSPKDCALLFNVCDPVICPESRCDLGGAYRVSNVIQSGIIGGLLLCLPNFGMPSDGGVLVPVCLTGINAGIESLLSIYKNYGDCLQHSLDTGETVGICDEIHSIYLCDFFWKQAIPFLDITIPTAIQFLLTAGRGGGEYMDVQGSWDAAGRSVNYFTNYYGANAFAAFKVRLTDEIGSAVCKNFISARYPASGDFFDALVEPDSPSQYHGWFHETTFTTATVPPTSQYKVFYHIYAGKDIGVYYSVYLKNPTGSSFYADASRVDVASGYIERGGYASETKDMLQVSGYKKLCINVQGQEECGFKEVSTSFALDYVQDEYVKDQAERTDIKSEKECISGSASLYSMLTPNIQAGAERVLDPQIYNQGIVRVCATDNPGESTDNSRWVNVGTCGGNIKCWLDEESVGEAVVFNSSLEGLKEVKEDALEKLREAGNYLSFTGFEDLIKRINVANNNEKIKLIDDALSEKSVKKVFFNREKAKLLYLKVRVYVGLVVDKGKDIFSDEDQNPGGMWNTGVEEKNNGEVVAVKTEPILPKPTFLSEKDTFCFEDEKLKTAIAKYSGGNNIPENLIKAIILQESNCENKAHLDKTSFGYMGITEIASKDVGKEKLFENNLWMNVDNNINIGTTYYKKLQEDYGLKDKKIILAAYNWGIGNINNACPDKTWESCEGIPNVVLKHVSNILEFENSFGVE